MNVRLSQKYGLNPTVPLCFWCQKSKNEVDLLGAGYHGQAPMSMLLDYNPCNECAEGMALGIVCIEAGSAEQLKRPAFAREGALSVTAPTGRWVVVKREAMAALYQGDQLDSILSGGKVLMEEAVFETLFSNVLEKKHDENNQLRVQERGTETPDAPPAGRATSH